MTAGQVVRKYFEDYTAGRLDEAASWMAEDVFYDDMAFPEPMRGRERVREHLGKVARSAPEGLGFVVDGMSEGEREVGVMWSVKLDDVDEVPNGRGVSFYRVNEGGLIEFGRDIPEPPVKGGEATLGILKGAVWLLRAAKNPDKKLKPLLLWLTVGAYFALVMLSDWLPGQPAYNTPPESLQEVVNCSWDFFFVSPVVKRLGLPDPFPAPFVHPARLGLFNFVCSWSLLFGGLIASDAKAKSNGVRRVQSFIGIMLLTNVFMLPYVAARQGGDNARAGTEDFGSGRWLGFVGLFMGVSSLAWLLFADPQVGGFADRLAELRSAFASDRVQFAFGSSLPSFALVHDARLVADDATGCRAVVDVVLYGLVQALLMGDEGERLGEQGRPGWRKYVPFFGLAAWLIERRPEERR